MSLEHIQGGEYGSPESRTTQIDSMMRAGLSLRSDQIPTVHDINLRYSRRIEEEVVKPDLSHWAKYRQLMKIQRDKDQELQPVLTADQFEKYVTKRDQLFWEGVKAFFF